MRECRRKTADVKKGIHKRSLIAEEASFCVLSNGFGLATTNDLPSSSKRILDSACTTDVSSDEGAFDKLQKRTS